MSQSKKANLTIILVLFVSVIAFAYSYNASVTSAVTNAAYNDKEILQNYNNEIISKLCKQDSIEDWSTIVEQYQDIVIEIENSNNRVVTKSVGRTWSALDVKVLTPFDYKGEAYLIKSSVYLLRDYVADVRELVKFIFIEFLIGLAALGLLIFIIYTVMLRPYRVIYKEIGEYDRTGKLNDIKLKGYAGKVYSRFVKMAKNLERQQDNQRRIIASISHDIKTPLTSIMGYSERLRKEGLSEERRARYIETVYGKAVDIQQIVLEFDEYLSYNMPYQLKLEKVSVGEIVDDLTEKYAMEFEGSAIEFAVRNYADIELTVDIDTQRMKRVFSNIIANSVKHFKATEKKLRVDICHRKDRLEFVVSDNGEGVDEDKLEIIFEPLYTSDEGRKVAGLGLAICREIIEAHKGIIYARKSDIGGLAICIELPVTHNGEHSYDTQKK